MNRFKLSQPMKVSNLPPLTAANEPLHNYISYLEMLLRLLLSGIDAGEFDGDHRRACTDAIRGQL